MDYFLTKSVHLALLTIIPSAFESLILAHTSSISLSDQTRGKSGCPDPRQVSDLLVLCLQRVLHSHSRYIKE